MHAICRAEHKVIEFAAEAIGDLQRILDHLDLHQLETARDRIREIVAALDVLEHNLRIGRLVRLDMRELVIGRHAHGYIVLYRYVFQVDTFFILAIRSQPEAGYSEPSPK